MSNPDDDPKSSHFSGRARGQRLTQPQFNQLLLSYRTSLTDHTSASRAAGVSYGTAKKAFERGLVVEGVAKEPIADTVGRELRSALVELSKVKTEQMSRSDTVLTIERELIETQMTTVQMSRGATSNAMAGLAITSHILNGAVSLAARVSRLLDDPSYCPSPRDAASLLRVLMHTGHFAMESARISQELETAIRTSVDLRRTSGGMTIEEAQEVLQSSGRSAARIARAQARAGLPEAKAPEIFDVGQGSPVEDVLDDGSNEFAGDDFAPEFDHED